MNATSHSFREALRLTTSPHAAKPGEILSNFVFHEDGSINAEATLSQAEAVIQAAAALEVPRLAQITAHEKAEKEKMSTEAALKAWDTRRKQAAKAKRAAAKKPTPKPKPKPKKTSAKKR